MAGPTYSYNFAPGEEPLCCPYDGSHAMLNTTKIKHLQKCRENHIKEKGGEHKADFAVCKWNWGHHIPKQDIKEHEAACSYQSNVLDHIEYHQSEEFKAHASAQMVATQNNRRDDVTPGNEEEDWEKESNGRTPGYDPKTKLNNGPVIPLVPLGRQPAERKKFRDDERRRQQEYQRTQSLDGKKK